MAISTVKETDSGVFDFFQGVRKMDNSLDRRKLLKLSAGVAVAGIAAPFLLTGTASAATTQGELAPVQGMLGDRLANELWYQLDEVSMYNPAQNVLDAYDAIWTYFGAPGLSPFYDNWLKMSQDPAYPHNYTEYVTPIKDSLKVLSQLQLGVFDTYYPYDEYGLIKAFAAFGQGVLYDPRRAAAESEVHTMDGDPPRGYHTWHSILRGMMFLGIDAQRWARLDPLIGYGWALQSIAKPDHRNVNPGLPSAQVQSLALSWLPRDVNRLDLDFRSYPYPA